MQNEERPRVRNEPLGELTDFPVGVSASRSIRDYETPFASHSSSSGSRSSSSWERVV
jgi:hypothetical protein